MIGGGSDATSHLDQIVSDPISFNAPSRHARRRAAVVAMLVVIDVKWSPGILCSSTRLQIPDQPSDGRKSYIVSERNTASRPENGAGS